MRKGELLGVDEVAGLSGAAAVGDVEPLALRQDHVLPGQHCRNMPAPTGSS